MPAEYPNQRRSENHRHVNGRLGFLDLRLLKVVVAREATGHTQVPDRQPEVEALALEIPSR